MPEAAWGATYVGRRVPCDCPGWTICRVTPNASDVAWGIRRHRGDRASWRLTIAIAPPPPNARTHPDDAGLPAARRRKLSKRWALIRDTEGVGGSQPLARRLVDVEGIFRDVMEHSSHAPPAPPAE